MAKLSQLIDTLKTHTGIPAPVIEHYASKLSAAGRMPERGADLLPEDAATLIVALAASAGANEAVENVEAYLLVPMIPPPMENTDMAQATESVIACLALLLEQIPSRSAVGLPGPVTLEIRRSIEAPFASIYVKSDGDTLYRFVFAPSFDRTHSLAWQQWQQVDDALFVAVAELFDERHAVVGERHSLALH